MRLIGLIVVSFLFTILFTSALIVAVPYDLTDKLIWVGMSVPLAWCSAMFYCYWDNNPLRPLVVLSSLSACSSILILTLPVPS